MTKKTLGVLLLIAESLMAQHLLSYRGVITDHKQQVLRDSSYNFTFTLYGDSTSEQALWQESDKRLAVRNGIITTYLGSQTPLEQIDFSTTLWLGIHYDTNRVPGRIRLNPAPQSLFAFRADTALFARQAQTARRADSAGRAEYADSALHTKAAVYSDTASRATIALRSDTATYAHFASFSAHADSAAHTQKSFSALHADSSTHATTADSSTVAKSLIHAAKLSSIAADSLSVTSKAHIYGQLELERSSGTDMQLASFFNPYGDWEGETVNIGMYGTNGYLNYNVAYNQNSWQSQNSLRGVSSITFIGGKILLRNNKAGESSPINRVTVDTTGFVGIGTTNPSHLLEMSGTQPHLQITSAKRGTPNVGLHDTIGIVFRQDGGNGGTANIFWDGPNAELAYSTRNNYAGKYLSHVFYTRDSNESGLREKLRIGPHGIEASAPITANESIKLKSPDGTVFTLKVKNDGTLYAE